MIVLLLLAGGSHVPLILQQKEGIISFEQLFGIVGWTLSVGAYLGFIVQNIRVLFVEQSVDAVKQMNESWVRNRTESLCTNLLVS